MYKIFRMVLVLFIFIALVQCQKTRVTFKGKVFTADGQSPELAHLHLFLPGSLEEDPVQSVTVSGEGTFSTQLPAGHNYLQLVITAPYHPFLSVPLVIKEGSSEIEMNFHLNGYAFQKDYAQLFITGNWSGFSRSKAEPMQKQEDGTFTFEIPEPGDTIKYQILGITQDMRAMNGTQYDFLEYDSSGSYRSVIVSRGNPQRIVFDPKLLPDAYRDTLPDIVLVSGDSLTLGIMDIAIQTEKFQKYLNMSKYLFQMQHGSLRGFRFNFQPYLMYLDKQINSAGDELVAHYARFQRIRLMREQINAPVELAQALIDELPLSHPLWSYHPEIVPFVLTRALGEEKAFKTLEASYDEMYGELTKGFVLLTLAIRAKQANDTEKFERFFSLLEKGKYEQNATIKHFMNALKPETTLAVGEKIPAFEVLSLDGKGTISNATLKGSYYLLDFWATWCAPCVAEMPYLHKAYEKFKDRNFTIVSLSFDNKREDIDHFRSGRWNMPWLHSFLEGEKKQEIGTIFRVQAIPKTILVDPKGIIVAKEADLRGENLEKTLEKIIK